CDISSDDNGIFVTGLCIVKVHMSARGHDYLVMLVRSINSAIFTPPAHYNGVRRQSPFQNLIPPDNRTTLTVNIFFHSLNKITLQGMFVLKVVILHPFLTFR